MCLGMPGLVTAIVDEATMTVEIDVSGVRRSVNAICVAEAGAPFSSLIGQWVLVYSGFALSRISEHEATATLALLRELEEMSEGAPASVDGVRVVH